MTLQELEYFRTLAKVENFTKAAEILSVSQPSLSYAIKQLEMTLGVRLFDRVGRNIKLNSYGKIFLTYVEKALDTLEQGIENMKLLTKTMNYSVRIGYIYSLTDKLLTDIIKGFYSDSDNGRFVFDFKINSSAKLNEDLEKENLDLVLTAIPPKNSNYVEIFSQELFLVVPKGHPLSNRSEIDLDEIKGADFINFRSSTSLRKIIDDVLKSKEVAVSTIMEIDECNAALSLLYLNVGITIMPIVPGIDYSKVVLLKIKDKRARRKIYLAWKDNINSNVKKFLDYIINFYKDS